jgi:hypothetical protein
MRVADAVPVTHAFSSGALMRSGMRGPRSLPRLTSQDEPATPPLARNLDELYAKMRASGHTPEHERPEYVAPPPFSERNKKTSKKLRRLSRPLYREHYALNSVERFSMAAKRKNVPAKILPLRAKRKRKSAQLTPAQEARNRLLDLEIYLVLIGQENHETFYHYLRVCYDQPLVKAS